MIITKQRESFASTIKLYSPSNSVGAEIGVLHGDFSKLLLEVVNPKKLFLVDPYTKNNATYGEKLGYLTTAYSNENDYQNLIKRFEQQICLGQIEIIRKYSYEAVDFFLDEIFDFIYFDASHLYQDLKRDLNDWLPKMKENSIIAGHDYIEFDTFGVKQAVDEFCQENGFEMIVFNSEGGDWILKRKERDKTWLINFAKQAYKDFNNK
jgi:hypothetical protein